MASERVAIFIDAGYVEKTLKHEFKGTAIDYGKLCEHISHGENLLRSYYYNCPPYQSNPPTAEEAERKAKSDTFYFSLRKLPKFEIRLGRLAKRACHACGALALQQKRADLMLGVDLVNLSARMQIGKAILIAGDSDLLPAVVASKECGVQVHLYHGATPHKDLVDACDERTAISKALIDKIKRS